MSLYYRIGYLGVVTLVLLRVCVGYHFFMEGASKIKSGDFSSAGFLSSAQGPLRDQFRSLLPDQDGLIRLDAARMTQLINDYGEKIKSHYQLDEDGQNEVDLIVARQIRLIKEVYKNWTSDLEKYRRGFDRMAEMQQDSKWRGVASLRGQQNEIEKEWRGLAKPALAEIDRLVASLDDQLNSLVDGGSRFALHFRYPDESLLGARTVDRIIPYFDLTVGILLMIGLLARWASLAGGLFLVSVILTQFPGYPDTQPTYYQAIEAIACFVLSATDAGRYAGLDFIPWAWKVNRMAAAT